MELDDFKSQWAEYDRKLDTSIHLSTQVLRETRMSRLGSNLKWAFRGILFEQLMSIPAVALLAIFIRNHISDPRYVVPAAVLDLFAIYSVVSCGWQMGTLSSIDYGQPVVTIQKKIQKVKLVRLATVKWGFLLWPILWIPFTIVFFRGIFGIDGYVMFRGSRLAIDLAAGAAITALLYVVSNRLADRVNRLPLAQRVFNELAGRNLSKATAFLEQLRQFETEDQRG